MGSSTVGHRPRVRLVKRAGGGVAMTCGAVFAVIALLASAAAADPLPAPAPVGNVIPIPITISHTPALPQVGEPVTFTATPGPGQAIQIADISWDLGSDTFTDGSGETVTKTFASAGDYTIRAQVTLAGGSVSTILGQPLSVLPAQGPILSPAVIVKPVLRLILIRGRGSRVALRFTCAFAPCHTRVRMTTYRRRHMRDQAGSFTAKAGRRRMRIRIGSRDLHLRANRSRTVSFGLDRRGRRLLARLGRLPVEVSLSDPRVKRPVTLRSDVKTSRR